MWPTRCRASTTLVVMDPTPAARDARVRAWGAVLADGERRRARRTRRVSCDGRRHPARRPRHHHLHLGHDRRPQGRDAHARQHRRQRRRLPAGRRAARRRQLPVVPAAVPHLRAHGRALRHARLRAPRSRTRERRDRGRRRAGGAPDRAVRCAALLREGLRARHGERRHAAAAAARASSAGGSASAQQVARLRFAGKTAAAVARASRPHRRPAGGRQGARARRRPHALLHLGRRAARPQGDGVLLRHRHPDDRGLRAHRDLAGHLPERARPRAPGRGRTAGSGRRGALRRPRARS